MTKKMRDAYNRYCDSDIDSLYRAYGRCSEAKRKAWEGCKKLCLEKNGADLRIIGHNTSFFSAGFIFEEGGVKKFMFITRGGTYTEALANLCGRKEEDCETV